VSIKVGSAASLYRLEEHPRIWEHRGKVAAVGIGHAPTMRRWDFTGDTSVGAWTVLAIRRAIADAGVAPEDVDGLALCENTSHGSSWPDGQEVPEDFRTRFVPTANPLDGLARISAEWILKNVPELKNVKYVVSAPVCMSAVLTAAIQAVGDGLASVCVAVKGWHNFRGRYGHGGANLQQTVSGDAKWIGAVAGPPIYRTAVQFQRYLHKYGKTHDMMAPFIVNSRRNGLLFPEGYWAQHRPEPVTVDDYLNAPLVAEPANLLDNDLPIHTAGAYIITTSGRAKDMRQPPAYVLGHAGTGIVRGGQWLPMRSNGVIEPLEDMEEWSAATGRKVYESAGITARDVTFENMYDGFSLFHVFHIEGLGFAGIKRGEALDLFQTDISIEGPNPVSPSGGNIGGGRSRFWNHTDTIQQIQGRAGARAVKVPIVTGISGGWQAWQCNAIVWSPTPG
jgi:acetyl-CoA acetyltransferase